jgi:ribosomal protein S27E
MAEVTLSLKHLPSQTEASCGVCGATFVPAEDSGSRSFTIGTGKQDFVSVMCGGCHSKWSHGSTIRIRSVAPPA